MENSKEMASKYRLKQLEKVGKDSTQINERDLKYAIELGAMEEKQRKIDRIRQEREAKEEEELTFAPKTNKKMNDLYA